MAAAVSPWNSGDRITIVAADEGPGIENVSLAMQEDTPRPRFHQGIGVRC